MKSLYVFNSLEITDLDHIQREISRGLFQTLCIQHSFKSRDGNSLFNSTMNIRILYGKDFQIRYLNHQRCIMLSRGGSLSLLPMRSIPQNQGKSKVSRSYLRQRPCFLTKRFMHSTPVAHLLIFLLGKGALL